MRRTLLAAATACLVAGYIGAIAPNTLVTCPEGYVLRGVSSPPEAKPMRFCARPGESGALFGQPGAPRPLYDNRMLQRIATFTVGFVLALILAVFAFRVRPQRNRRAPSPSSWR